MNCRSVLNGSVELNASEDCEAVRSGALESISWQPDIRIPAC